MQAKLDAALTRYRAARAAWEPYRKVSPPTDAAEYLQVHAIYEEHCDALDALRVAITSTCCEGTRVRGTLAQGSPITIGALGALVNDSIQIYSTELRAGVALRSFRLTNLVRLEVE